ETQARDANGFSPPHCSPLTSAPSAGTSLEVKNPKKTKTQQPPLLPPSGKEEREREREREKKRLAISRVKSWRKVRSRSKIRRRDVHLC
ncbi:hypothetical protein AMELA_G00211000, partial [Ameiurus melas]